MFYFVLFSELGWKSSRSKMRTEKHETAATIQKIQTVLRCIFRQAYCWNVIKENPMSRVKLPRNMAKKESLKFFTPDQAKRFLALCSNNL